MKRKSRKRHLFRRKSKTSTSLTRDLEKATNLLDQRRTEEAIALLEPYVKQGVKDARLHSLLGIAYTFQDQVLLAIEQLESACALEKNPHAASMLGELYIRAGAPTLALDAFRKAQKWEAHVVAHPVMQEQMALSREYIREVAHTLSISTSQAEKGLKLLEQGRMAVQRQNFFEGIKLYAKARRLLGDYPPLLNELAMAHFYHGDLEGAEATVREVLAKDSENVVALSILIRFRVMTGREEEAREIWRKLQAIEPDSATGLLKKAEAAALLEEDQIVYDLLHPHIDELSEISPIPMRYLAIAAANLGKRTEAIDWFRKLKPYMPFADQVIEALEQGKPGLGLAERYYYLDYEEVLPESMFSKLLNLLNASSSESGETFQERVESFVQRFPQIYLLLKRSLWEQENREEIIDFLSLLGTPEAYAILKEFALGQKGSRDDRAHALQVLVDAEAFPPGTTLKFWDDDGVKVLEVRKTILDPGHFQQYDTTVFNLLEAGYQALEEGRRDDAREAFQRALEHDPQVKEAYNNLATFAMQEGRVHEAKALLNKALEIDPNYLVARTNLAQLFVREGRIDKAEAILKPIAQQPPSHPFEVAALARAQAHILIEKAEYVKAEALLEKAVEAYPRYIAAQQDLNSLRKRKFPDWSLELTERFQKGWMRDALRYRKRQQKKLTNPHPTLAEALSIYTKDQLKAMGWHIAPEGRWSQLRKQELLDLLVERMKQPETLERLLDSLTPYERHAFADVLAQGGVMDWDAFNDAYGNDFTDSPYWEYHEPQTPMGRLRIRGLLVEARDGDRLVISIPMELREMVQKGVVHL